MIDNFDTVEEWQEFFDSRYPDGVSLFRSRNDLHFLSPWVRVTEVEDTEPTLEFFPVHNTGKVFSVRVEGVEEKSEKELLLKTNDDESNWIFSTNFSPEIGDEMRKFREEQDALREKYAD